MGRYIIRRSLQAIPLLFLLSIFMFLLIHALPGGPEQVIFNPHLDPAGRAALRARFGLDDPLPIQYLKWIGNFLIGNFGSSFATSQPVSQVLAQRFPNTLQLFSIALVVALVLAIFLGVISAVRQNSALDYTVTTLSYFGLALPAFLLGLFLQDIFAVQLHWLPVSGTASLGYTFDPFNAFYDH
ncbi:MAG: ABC transporter permease [Chloroflexi bacterium]|nr:MAG: ABC transporter permease [Chloroflexota bacterium]